MDRTETLSHFIETRNFSDLFQKGYLVILIKLLSYEAFLSCFKQELILKLCRFQCVLPSGLVQQRK